MALGIFKLVGKGLSSVLGTKTGKVLAWGGAAYAATAVTGKGLITIGTGVGKNILLDKEEREKGAIKGLYRQLADTSLGEGTADVIDQKAGELAQGAVNGAMQVKDAAAGALGAGVDMVQGGVQRLTGNGQQPQYVDPNTGYYPQQTMMNGGTGLFTGMFNSVPQMIGNMTGGHVTLSNLAALIASGYMMMGHFGWFGKIASLLMGNMALKSMRQQPTYAMPQQGYYPQMQQPYSPAVQPAPQQLEENNPVYRSRHI